jgi:hypothetical protein
MCEFRFVPQIISCKASSRGVSQSKIAHGWHEDRVKSVEIFGPKMDKSHPLKNPPHLYQYSFSLSYVDTLLVIGREVSEIVRSKPLLQYLWIQSLKERCGSRIRVAGILKGNSLRSSTICNVARIPWQQPHNFSCRNRKQISRPHVAHLQMLEAFQITLLRNYRQPHEPTLTSGLRTKHLQPATGTWLNNISGRPIFIQLLCCRQHLKHAAECLSTCCGIQHKVCDSENNYFYYRNIGCCYIKLLHV